MKNVLTKRTLCAMASTLLLVALFAGCDKDEYGLKFSHWQHAEDLEIACADCHGKLTAKGFKAVEHEACAGCHEEQVDADAITAKTCGYCHKVKNLDDLGSEEAQPNTVSRGVFVHTDALTKMCGDCHGGLLRKKLNRVPEMTRGTLVAIRDRSHALNMPCAACHANMDPKTEPASHAQNWTARHGTHGEQEPALCSVCHQEETCRECHQTTMPQSHNNLWRTRTHGITAGWDRQRCQVCHEQDFCSSCHAEVRPRSHNASWKQRHCTQCHTSTEAGTGCAVCHEATLDTHPSPHSAGWRTRHCDTCHPGSPEEETCRLCHPGSIDTHPNPHSAGWRSRHCDNCHVGTAEEEECRLCHPGSIDSHVNPHTAAWRSRHCFSCHAGSDAAEECGICHEGASSLLVHQDFWPPVHNRFGDQIDCYFCHKP